MTVRATLKFTLVLNNKLAHCKYEWTKSRLCNPNVSGGSNREHISVHIHFGKLLMIIIMTKLEKLRMELAAENAINFPQKR